MSDEGEWPEELVERINAKWAEYMGLGLAPDDVTWWLNTLTSDPEAKRAIMGEPVGYVTLADFKRARDAGDLGDPRTPVSRRPVWQDSVPLYAITEETSDDED